LTVVMTPIPLPKLTCGISLVRTQVYLLSAEARCNALASAMTSAYLLDASFDPPGLPPLDTVLVPPPPPPPPSPPRPKLPRAESDHIVYIHPTRVVLSTYFIGGYETDAATASTATGNLMPLTNLANATRAAALNLSLHPFPYTQWVACPAALTDAPLPCRSGDAPGRCVDGHRRCGTTEANTEAPFMELDLLHEWPTDRDYYFFAMELTLPTAPALARLLFESSQGGDGGRLYEVTVYDESHNPLPTQCKPAAEQSVDYYQEGFVHFQYVCLEALATDAAYAAMRHVRFVRLTLPGAYRMLWFESVRLVLRTLRDLAPSPPPSPTSPPAPPAPVAPPDAPAPDASHVCVEHPGKAFADGLLVEAIEEPCHLTPAQCCAHAYAFNHTVAYTLSASGCCTLLGLATPDAGVAAALANGTLTPTVDVGYGGARTGVRAVVVV